MVDRGQHGHPDWSAALQSHVQQTVIRCVFEHSTPVGSDHKGQSSLPTCISELWPSMTLLLVDHCSSDHFWQIMTAAYQDHPTRAAVLEILWRSYKDERLFKVTQMSCQTSLSTLTWDRVFNISAYTEPHLLKKEVFLGKPWGESVMQFDFLKTQPKLLFLFDTGSASSFPEFNTELWGIVCVFTHSCYSWTGVMGSLFSKRQQL